MTFVSYAQNFEDVLLWRALHEMGHGPYLDIGAQDPVVDSVSLAFYKAGWRGVHVEATPAYAARLRDARPDETVIEAAVTDVTGPIEFYEIPETGISTGRQDIAASHAESGYQSRKILVPTVRLDQILERDDRDMQWMKIDVEGMEADVLRSWGESRRRPWIVVVEATFPGSQEPTEHLWIDLVQSRGYREVHFDGLSRYFLHEAHENLAGHFAAPPNVFDGFVVPKTHFSASQLVGTLNAELESAQAAAAQRQTELEAELRDSRSAADLTRDELDRARAALEAASAARDAATSERDQARENEKAALARLIAAEQQHRAALERLWRERHEAEDELRDAARELEQSVRGELRQAETIAAESRLELARIDERTVQQQELLRRADEAATKAAERLADEQRQVLDLRMLLEQARSDADRQRRESDAALDQANAQLEQMRVELGRQIDQQRAAIAKADALIGGVLAELTGRRQRLGLALGLARPSRAINALSDWLTWRQAAPEAPPDAPRNQIVELPMPSTPGREMRNPYLRADSLAELLSWHDVDFVRCAYVTVLGRQPDPEGEAYHTDRIRRGHSKMEVLWQLRRSAEGPSHDPGIAGFDRALRRAAWARTPLAGPLLCHVTKQEGDSRWERHLRALSNQFALARQELADALSRVDAHVHCQSDKVDNVRKGCEAITHSINGLQSKLSDGGISQLSQPETRLGSAGRNSSAQPTAAPLADRLLAKIRSIAHVGE